MADILSIWNAGETLPGDAPDGGKVIVSPAGVASFNRTWPCSRLRDRSYWFEFDAGGNLIDTDCPESDDGPESAAMADDCKAWLFDSVRPDWAPIPSVGERESE